MSVVTGGSKFVVIDRLVLKSQTKTCYLIENIGRIYSLFEINAQQILPTPRASGADARPFPLDIPRRL